MRGWEATLPSLHTPHSTRLAPLAYLLRGVRRGVEGRDERGGKESGGEGGEVRGGKGG